MSDSPLTALLALAAALLEVGAEPYRTEEAVERAGNGFGCGEVQVFVTPPGLFVSVAGPNGHETGVRRVRHRSTDLGRLTSLNSIARAAERGDLSPKECLQAIAGMQNAKPPYGLGTDLLAGAVASSAYAWFIGATHLEAGLAALAGAFTILMRRRQGEHFAERFFLLAASSFVVGLVGVAGSALWRQSVGEIVAGGLVVLVPGLALTGVLRDLLAGDFLSAAAGGLEVLTVAGALAAGVALAVAAGGIALGWH